MVSVVLNGVRRRERERERERELYIESQQIKDLCEEKIKKKEEKER